MKSHYLRAKEIFEKGENISVALNAELPPDAKSEIIQYAYDLQAGSYTKQLDRPDIAAQKERAGSRLAHHLAQLGVHSVCDAGTGEATTLRYIANHLTPDVEISAFDVSLSRLLYARAVLGLRTASLFCGDLSNIPLADGAVDAITTFHAFEPNGGREARVVSEALRVTSRYLVLVEPDYETARESQKARMERLGYVRDLRSTLAANPGRVIVDEPWEDDANPENAASLIIFEKATRAPSSFRFRSPISGSPVLELEGGTFLGSPADGFIYPIVREIPVLLESAAVLASHIWNIDR